MSMPSASTLPPRVVAGIRSYTQSRSGNHPVSVNALMRAARYAIPDMPFSDKELSNLIARQLVDANCNIEFDSSASYHEIAIERR